jgi:hypothetical protein
MGTEGKRSLQALIKCNLYCAKAVAVHQTNIDIDTSGYRNGTYSGD